jgi:hypothetical protein
LKKTSLRKDEDIRFGRSSIGEYDFIGVKFFYFDARFDFDSPIYDAVSATYVDA